VTSADGPRVALLAAFERGDPEAFDGAVTAIGGARPMLDALLETIPAEKRERARALLPEPRAFPYTSRIDVAALHALGAIGFWEASAWALRVIPIHERRAPSPPHEQWDALVEIHRARLEAPWLVIELLASLAEAQRPLGRRILLGLERRFGARVKTIAATRLELGDAALSDVLESLASGD
jgi:hypothetical protein